MISLFTETLAPSPVDNFWYGSPSHQTTAGININPDVAMTYSAVWACTRVLSASGSVLPLSLMRRSGNMTEIAADNPVHRLIHDMPNTEMGSMGLRSIGLMRQINNGNFFAEIVRKSGVPVALWPIANDRVTPARTESGELAWQIRQPDGHHEYLRDRDMFNVRSIVSDDGIVGKGVIENARETIAHGMATVQQGAAYMKNSARPSVVITGGKFRDAEDRESYRRMWMDVHGGAANNAKPAMLPADSELKVLSFSPEDSQFIQTMQHNIEDVARWYGVPPHMIQHLLRSTFNNVEQMGIDFVVYSLIPWLKMWEEEIYRKLLSPVEQETHYAKHNVTGLLRGDSAARAAYYQSLWQLGAYSINEIRELEDMNPIPDGDQHFVQTSYTTLESIGKELEPTAMPVIEPPTENDEGELAKKIDELLKYQRSIPEPTPAESTVDDGRICAVQQAAKLMIEETSSRMLTKEINALDKAAGKQPSEFFTWCDEFYSDYQPKLSAALRRPVQAYITSLGAFVDAATVSDAIAQRHIEVSKESVLQATEVQHDEWHTIGGRFAELGTDWRATRSEQCIEQINERVTQ